MRHYAIIIAFFVSYMHSETDLAENLTVTTQFFNKGLRAMTNQADLKEAAQTKVDSAPCLLS